MRLGQALERVAVPVLLQTGWQDRFPAQMIEQYDRLQQRGVEVGLTIGPWTHVETATKGAATVMTEALDWLAEHLAGPGARSRPRPSPVRIYVTGAAGVAQPETWPPPTSDRVFYLHPEGGLNDTPPSSFAGPDNVHVRPGRSHPGGRWPRDQPGDRWSSRQPEARGARRTL